MFLVIALVFSFVFATVIVLAAVVGFVGKEQQKDFAARLEAVTVALRRKPHDEGLSILREEMLSSIPVINRWLLKLDLFPKFQRVLGQSELKWTLTGLALRCLGTAVVAAGGAYFRTRAWPFAAMLGAGAGTIPVVYMLFRRSQRFSAFEAKLPEALELMVRALRAGHGLMPAVEMVANEFPNPIGGEFRVTFEEQNFGLDLRQSMLNLAQRVPLHDVNLVVTAILIQKDTGGNLAEILEKVAYVIRERFRLKRQVLVHTAQGRMTGWILTVLPPALGVALYFINPDQMSKLWTHPTGLKLMYTAAVMTILGGLLIRKIVRIRI